MLLSPVKRAIRAREVAIELAGHVALSERMISRLERPSRRAPFDVAAGAGVVDHADHDDSPERLIRGAVATAVESFADGQPRRGVDRGDAAVMGECRLAAEALRVVAGGDEQSAGRVGAHAEAGHQGGCGGGDQLLEHGSRRRRSASRRCTRRASSRRASLVAPTAVVGSAGRSRAAVVTSSNTVLPRSAAGGRPVHSRAGRASG